MNTKIETDSAAFEAADVIARLSISLTGLQADMENQLAAVRAKFQPSIEQAEAKRRELLAMLKNYCARKAAVGTLFVNGRRCSESTLARFGWRDSAPSIKPLETKTKLEDVAAELFRTGHTEYVIAPEPKYTINKAAVLNSGLGPGALADLGLRIITPTTFYVEPLDKSVTAATTSRS